MKKINLFRFIFTLLRLSILLFVLNGCKNDFEEKIHPNEIDQKQLFKKIGNVHPDSILITNVDIDLLPIQTFSNLPKTILETPIKTLSKGKPIRVMLELGKAKITVDSILLKDIASREISNPFEFKLSKEMASKDYNSASFTSFDKLQGLSHSFVTSLMEDYFGNLWIGTHNGGITKYDGKYFSYINSASGLSGNLIFAMKQLRDSSIWIGAFDHGLSIYDGLSITNIREQNGLNSNKIYDIDEDENGHIWVASLGGLARFNPADLSQFTTITSKNGLPTNSLSALKWEGKNKLWIGTEGDGLMLLKDDLLYKFTDDPILSKSIITKIIKSEDGSIWVSTYGDGLIKITASGSQRYTIQEGLPSNKLTSIYENKQKEIWVGTDGEGVFKLSFANNNDEPQIETFNQTKGLTNNNVYSVIQDSYDNMWIGTQRGGINKYNGNKFSHFQQLPGATQPIFTITEDENAYWLGSHGNGIYKVKKDFTELTQITSKENLPSDEIFASLKDRFENVWMGTHGAGIVILNNNTFRELTIDHGLPSNVVNALLIDSKNNIWIGTEKGLAKYSGKEIINYGIHTKDLATSIYDIEEDNKGRIWIGTEGDGVIILDKNDIYETNSKYDIDNQVIFSLAKDSDGNIWLGSEGNGTYVISDTSIYNINEQNGLANNYVFSLLNDKNNNLWLGTRLGLSILTNEKRTMLLNKIATKSSIANTDNCFNNYTYEDGFTGLGSNRGAIFQSKNGIIWVGTTDRLTLSTLSQDSLLYSKKLPPNVQIKKIEIYNESVNWSDFKIEKNKRQELANGVIVTNVKFSELSKWETVPKDIILNHDNNYLSFTFVGITQSQPSKIRYQYRVDGLSKDWSGLTSNNIAYYSNLSPGQYAFQVRAVGSSGELSNVESISFFIREPWWMTWWMKVLYALLLVTIIFYIHKNQKAKTIKNERLKSQAKELEQAKEIEKAYKEVKETQNQLIQAEKMASLGELTAGISHEIQNPLNFINNFAEVSSEMIEDLHDEIKNQDLEEIATIADSLKLNLDKITHHGKRAESIVRSMLLHSRNTTGQKEATDINALCEEYMRLSYHGYRAKDKTFNSLFKTNLDLSIPKIDIVPQDMGRVILNMLNNAFYAVNQMQKEATTPADYSPLVTLETTLNKEHVIIKIKDNGKGIKESILSKIFQPFFTTKPTGQGTGLGLSLAYDIITKHNGILDVQSKENEGTEFIIKLPLKNS